MKKNPEVLWSEGMFLRPHHLQAAQRHGNDMLQQEIRRIQPFYWGLMSLDVALDQLEAHTFALRDLEIKMRDGTSLSLSSNLRLSPRGFKDELDAAGGRLEVHLGIPVWREMAPNTFLAGEDVRGRERRYFADAVDALDENTGQNPQPVETRRYNGKLFFGAESRDGYETLQIAVLERSGQGRNYPVLSKDFVPSVTEIGASPTLQALCDSITSRLEAKHRLLLSEVTQGRVTTEAEGTSAWQVILKLQTLGSFAFLFQQLTRIPRIHPFTIYCEFSRLMGELATFDDSKKWMRIPLYDHDKLGPCFHEVTFLLEGLTEKAVASRFQKVDFVAQEDLMVAQLGPDWTSPDTEMYLCIETELADKDLQARIETMKVGTVRDIPLLRQRRLFGLEIEMLKRAPSGFPSREDFHYFGMEREGPYWANVVRDKTLAISGGQDPKLRFSLYAVSKSDKAAR